jgi:hypothetical protein
MLNLGNLPYTKGLLGARASRPHPWRTRGPRSLVLAVAACLFGGCQGGPVKTDLDPNEKHILKIISLYSEFRAAHRGKPPRDARALKSWAQRLKKEKLAERGIENLDDAFVSPRDKQPYVLVKPEAARPGPGGRPAMLWVYEKTVGGDGKRMAANPMGYAFKVDEERLKKLLGPPGR